MENRYPLFAGGRILKKESLWDLRDYVYDKLQLLYQDYTDGVIKGCGIRVDGMNLVVEQGMLKYQKFIYLIAEEVRIPFVAENRMLALKAEFAVKGNHLDHITYEVRFFLDHILQRQENQIELCRFHLREGSALRDTYKNFYDMITEYDTVNLIYVTVAGRNRARLHPDIFHQYAKEMYLRDNKDIEDKVFCYHVFQQKGEVEMDLLDAYLLDKKIEIAGIDTNTENNMVYFEKLVKVLSFHNGNADDGKNRGFIIVE